MIHKEYSIGIDIGGTNTVFGIVNKEARIISKDSFPTRKYEGLSQYLKELNNRISSLIDEVGGKEKIFGIGIGAPGANYHTGEINATNLDWGKKINLAKLVENIFNLPVKVTNDANAAAMGEMTYGVAKGMKDFVMITLGTGLGSGIVSNGQIVYGYDGLAGELGHIIVDRSNSRLCGCGRKGCLETFCSSTGIVRTAKEFLEKSEKPSKLRNIPVASISSKTIYEAAVEGDELSKEIFNFTGKILGEALADFTAYSRPEAFVFFGGLVHSGDLLFGPVKKALKETLLFIYEPPKILISGLNENDGAILGASALGWQDKFQ